MNQPRDWLSELELLVWRFVHLVGPDLAGLSLQGLAGLYAYLARLGR